MHRKKLARLVSISNEQNLEAGQIVDAHPPKQELIDALHTGGNSQLARAARGRGRGRGGRVGGRDGRGGVQSDSD